MHIEEVRHVEFNQFVTNRPYAIEAKRTEPRITEYRHNGQIVALMIGCEPNPKRYIVAGAGIDD